MDIEDGEMDEQRWVVQFSLSVFNFHHPSVVESVLSSLTRWLHTCIYEHWVL